MAKKEAASAVAPERAEKATRVAQRTDVLKLEKAAKKLGPIENRKPADPIEHFRKTACEQGHSNWDPKQVVYSIDHRSFLIFCIDCQEFCAIQAGGAIPLNVPSGLVPAAE